MRKQYSIEDIKKFNNFSCGSEEKLDIIHYILKYNTSLTLYYYDNTGIKMLILNANNTIGRNADKIIVKSKKEFGETVDYLYDCTKLYLDYAIAVDEFRKEYVHYNRFIIPTGFDTYSE
jgi:hypothetical protein